MYLVDGESQSLWAVVPGGGTPVKVADLSNTTTGPSSCYSNSKNYPWGATVVGEYVYWIDDTCGSIWRTSVVTGMSTQSVAPGFDGFYQYNGITSDAAGNIWAGSRGDKILEIPASTQQPVVVPVTGGTIGDWADITVGGGYVYVTDGYSTIYRFAEPASGIVSGTVSLSTYKTGLSLGDGLAVDSAGNVYYSDYNNVFKIDATTRAVSELPQSCTNDGIENLGFYGGNLYFSSYNPGYVCQFNSSLTSATVYATSANPTADPGFNPEGFGVYGVGSTGSKPVDLRAVNNRGTLVATWQGQGPWTCRLLYGFNSPSSFSVRTTADRCVFYNVGAKSHYGVQVSSSGGSATAWS